VTGDRGGAKLYTPDLLALAVSLANRPLTGDLPLRGEARSRACGSTVTLGCRTNAGGSIEAVGVRATACAVGQAAAAIFAEGAEGRDREGIAAHRTSLGRWLDGEGPAPRWPGIERLEAAREYPGRHGAIVLAWDAALDALSKAGDPR